MGRGRHRLRTKEKLKGSSEPRIATKEVGYHHIGPSVINSEGFLNEILSLFLGQEDGNRFLRTENLNCIALCEGKTLRYH